MSKTNNVKREKAVAFVVARLTSSRLQSKQLRKVGDRTILDWIVECLKKCIELDEIVITTVAEEENLPLIEFAEQRGVKSFWYNGDVNHVTTRLRRAAEFYDADICMLISADCPLLHSPAIDDLISTMRLSPQLDLLGVKPKEQGKPSMMQGVIVSRKKSWQKADDMSDTPQLKEHQFPIMSKARESFNIEGVVLNHDIYSVPRRLSVDTPADLSFQNALYKRLIELGFTYSLPDALQLLNNDPDLVKINAHVHQRRFGESANNILFITDSETSASSNISLARQLIETQGWPVVFCCKNDKMASAITEKNLRCVIGSLGDGFTKTNSQTQLIDLDKIRDSFDLILIESDKSGNEIKAKLSELKIEVPVFQIHNRDQDTGSLNVFKTNELHEQKLCSTHEFTSITEVADKVIEHL